VHDLFPEQYVFALERLSNFDSKHVVNAAPLKFEHAAPLAEIAVVKTANPVSEGNPVLRSMLSVDP
jgi:hypothetical protein